MLTPGRVRVIALWLADCLCVIAVWSAVVLSFWWAGVWMRANGFPLCAWGAYTPAYYLGFWSVPLLFVVFNALLGLYQGSWMYPSAPLSRVEEFRRLIGSSVVVHMGVVSFFAFAYGTTEGFSRFVAVMSGSLVAILAQSFRNWMRALLYRLGWGQIPVLLAGSGETAAQVAAALKDDTYSGFRIAGYFDGLEHVGRRGRYQLLPSERVFRKLAIPYRGSLREIVPEAQKRDIKILLACQEVRLFRAQMEEFSRWFTYIDYIPSARPFPIFGARAICFDGQGGLEMVNQGRMKVKRFQKKVTDKILSAVVFLLVIPIFILVPILIKLTSRGPVFYRHARIGRNGKPFKIWKFRSMYVDADQRLERLLATDKKAQKEWQANFKLRKDPRVTLLGRFLRKTSLDELPQLFNVISGEMSLIGPRPIVSEEVGYYGRSYAVVSSVFPGVTGLWQVSGRSDVDYDQRVGLDTYYVLNWSLWMDFWILLRTFYSVLFMRGAR